MGRTPEARSALTRRLAGYCGMGSGRGEAGSRLSGVLSEASVFAGRRFTSRMENRRRCRVDMLICTGNRSAALMSSRINTTSSEDVCAKWTLLARTGGRLAHLVPALMLALGPQVSRLPGDLCQCFGRRGTADVRHRKRCPDHYVLCSRDIHRIRVVGRRSATAVVAAVGASISALGLLLVRDNVPAWLRVPVAMAFGLFVLAHFKRMRLANKPEGNGNGRTISPESQVPRACPILLRRCGLRDMFQRGAFVNSTWLSHVDDLPSMMSR